MKNPSNLVHQTLLKSQQRTSCDNTNMNRWHVFRTFSRHCSNCILLGRTLLLPGMPPIASSSTASYFVTLYSCQSIKLPTIFTLIYFSLYSNFTSSILESMASQVRNYYSQNNQEAHLETALARALMNSANHHCQSNVWTSNSDFKYNVGES